MTAVERLLATAQAEVGYIGKKSRSSLDDKTANPGGLYTKYARDLDALGDWYNGKKQGYDWCDVFADWCFVQTFGKETALALTCQPLKSLGAGTGYSLNYYKAKGRLFTTPEPGDQIFFGTSSTTSHTGLVSAVSGGCVYTIEGNAGSPSAVRACKYPLSYAAIKGYGRPDYTLVTDKEDDDMSKETFKENWQELRKELQAAPASSWSEDALQWAEANGIMLGDDKGNLLPLDLLTREQMAVMLYRFAQWLGLA